MREIFGKLFFRVNGNSDDVVISLYDGDEVLTHEQATTLAHAILAHIQEEERKRAAEKAEADYHKSKEKSWPDND